MPPGRAVKGRPARRNVEEQRVPNALELQPQGEVTKAKFCEGIRMLSQVATYQIGQRDNLQEVADTSRICELLRMNPPSFLCSSVTEDLKNLIEELKRVFDLMHFADEERVELAAYQMKGVARICQARKARQAMLIGDMDLARLMIHVQQVEEDKLKDRKEFNNKRAKTSGNEFRQQKSSANRTFFQQKPKGPAPSSGIEKEVNYSPSFDLTGRISKRIGKVAYELELPQELTAVHQIIMPPGSTVRGRPARRNVEEQRLPNASEVQPQ
ncbi:uncharacterized protein LOC125847135 [Solanum stenotomum]|uniref:uncharacterized protein LOC125847135 n=1 Tax=Solanum stenotomum TaxID=172797 RepID=UPI0020D0B13B|nr:uncharacterized protein LOC125847135 [Solanum stenotomum]